ncbi:MAG: hypothetical protein UW68_C0027G0009 [Candidatus Collierbacteria bacterium GW2011_GWB1_44_6]|uniref:Uncharacterized protein n=1 Tax=Candidatus Collierbacteria bacterium GW2011_GWB1_44_6 TaxID=1618384 RepID=A0A0G1JMX5_9BACT|nr:MAG: hypothetical protein UW68_C0027G0009 [Candidatus Collierbacteria bacterium GW2011_GWB1_44_6]
MKINRQIIDRSLFLYGSILTFYLVVSAFLNQSDPNSLIILLLFLPVALFFAIKLSSNAHLHLQKLLNLDRHNHPYFENFSLTTFINQSETGFLINLVLLCFAIVLILFRISLLILK